MIDARELLLEASRSFKKSRLLGNEIRSVSALGADVEMNEDNTKLCVSAVDDDCIDLDNIVDFKEILRGWLKEDIEVVFIYFHEVKNIQCDTTLYFCNSVHVKSACTIHLCGWYTGDYIDIESRLNVEFIVKTHDRFRFYDKVFSVASNRRRSGDYETLRLCRVATGEFEETVLIEKVTR